MSEFKYICEIFFVIVSLLYHEDLEKWRRRGVMVHQRYESHVLH